jgi:hypothetical protein
MAKTPKKVYYSEAELIKLFALKRIIGQKTPEMTRWLNAPPAVLNVGEQYNFDRILPFAIQRIDGWGEEELKMNFISQILPLAHLLPNGSYSTFYEKTISEVVNNIPLTTKTDFMVATGILDTPEMPYFHFQILKKHSPFGGTKRGLPSGDSMAQLLEAMLIAQEKNKNGKPVYGCEIVGKDWKFVVLEARTYCISNAYNSTNKDDLLSIIAILRHFIHILETELLDDM